ncbi:hypothetical protein FBQ85_20780 [Cytophagia bacterium CHB2]|nr:hypothetical protein [Cytophagia bacterium CHB2]
MMKIITIKQSLCLFALYFILAFVGWPTILEMKLIYVLENGLWNAYSTMFFDSISWPHFLFVVLVTALLMQLATVFIVFVWRKVGKRKLAIGFGTVFSLALFDFVLEHPALLGFDIFSQKQLIQNLRMHQFVIMNLWLSRKNLRSTS